MVSAQIRRRRWIVGLSLTGGALAVGGVAYAATRQAAADPSKPPKPGEQDEPKKKPKNEGPISEPKTGDTTTKNIPSRSGKRPYNEDMFPSSEAVRAILVGLNPPAYAGGAGPPSGQQMGPAVKLYQQHWNTLAKLGKLPSQLNRTRLDEDGVPGEKTLRAMEWSLELDWARLLNESGVFPK